jgi:NAD(P)-dependent dehydrogenase (short-subunit alcohol dehydrogenase family)
MTRRVVTITGGASGIGWACAELFVRQGWFVIIADKSHERASERIAARAADMQSIALDVTSTQSVEDVFAALYARHGRLDALINSAGIQQWTSLAEIDWNAWNAVLDVNLTGTLRCLQAAGRYMLRQGSGAIVNLSSVAGARGVPGRTPYAASKAGVEAVTRSAAVEWARAGIRVNAVAPGYVESELVEEYVQSGRLALGPILERIPMRRMARANEVADLIYYLCSDHASYVTGQVIAVDGGFLADYGVARSEPGSKAT